MFKVVKTFGITLGLAVFCLISVGADAATGRAGAANVRSGGFIGNAQSNARMPGMPTLPLVSAGNISTDVVVPDAPVDNGGGTTEPEVPPCWKNVPHAKAGQQVGESCIITECESGWVVSKDKTKCEECWKQADPNASGGYMNQDGKCIVTACKDGWTLKKDRNEAYIDVWCESVCPDGKPADSDYTVEDCMRDILACVNDGALPNGLNDMFNSDLRASIINGMNLCYAQVEKCVTTVRRGCKDVYGSRADVWIDFNSRQVQPEYYNFVLHKTGLTPTQAEATCLLLDRNTYAKSFAAVGLNDYVSGEYKNEVYAYNNQGSGTEKKKNPMGPVVNTDGVVDAQRGHYARWDATAAKCLLRVAAYNKDELITNKWLGIGDDQAAEVWKAAGETFTCNKDLFDFSLMNKTKSAALIGVTSGTAAGAMFGAIAGAGIAGKSVKQCKDIEYRKELLRQIKNNDNIALGALSDFFDPELGGEKFTSSTYRLTEDDCNAILDLADKYKEYNTQVETCVTLSQKDNGEDYFSDRFVFKLDCSESTGEGYDKFRNCFLDTFFGNATDPEIPEDVYLKKLVREKVENTQAAANANAEVENTQTAPNANAEVKNAKAAANASTLVEAKPTEENAIETVVAEAFACFDEVTTSVYELKEDGCAIAEELMNALGVYRLNLGKCTFKTLDKTAGTDYSIVCSAPGGGCVSAAEMKVQLEKLKGLVDLVPKVGSDKSRKKTIGKATGIGALIGAGAGGVATAITALIESDNINCRVGDGLGQVGYNKSYSIDRLKDLYVKWNLNLPDTQVQGGSTTVHDTVTWDGVCSKNTSQKDCAAEQFYYKNAAGSLEWIYEPCEWNGTACVSSDTLLKSYGVVTTVYDKATWDAECKKMTDSYDCNEAWFYYNGNAVSSACTYIVTGGGSCVANAAKQKSYGVK